MAITYSKFHTLRVLLQIQQNIVGLQKDMRANALAWSAMATAQNPTQPVLKQFMQDAAASYQTRLAWLLNYKNTNPNFPAITAMFLAFGGDTADITTLYNQMKAVADGLQAAGLNSYAAITTACNQILATVDAPDTLWPE